MNHAQKKTLARKLLSKKEKEVKTPIFQSANWEMRAEGRRKKLSNKIAKAKKRKIERLSKEKSEGKTEKKDKKLTQAERRQIERRAKRIKFIAKIKKMAGAAAVMAVSIASLLAPNWSLAANPDLDPRYEAEYVNNASSTIEYFYMGRVEMPLKTILELQWWSPEGYYMPTLIIEHYYFKGELTHVERCWKYLYWWQPEEATCQPSGIRS